MKADVLSLDGAKLKSLDLPEQFTEEYRPSLIKRAVLVVLGALRQRYGAMPGAGMRQAAKLSRRRREYKTAYKHGISRVPRKTMWRRGSQFGWVGAVAPGTRGGRMAHPAKSDKLYTLKINEKERKKAIRSALSGAAQSLIVVDNKFEGINKTKDLVGTFSKIGLGNDIERCKDKVVRAGKGKTRGRRYHVRQGPLIVVANKCDVVKSLKNVQGFDICQVNNLNASLLTLGHAGVRKTVWSEAAIERMKKEKLFY